MIVLAQKDGKLLAVAGLLLHDARMPSLPEKRCNGQRGCRSTTVAISLFFAP
jgi:hypothetical protein